MYIPKVSKPRPILFDLGDTLINFSAPNALPNLREGAALVYADLRQTMTKLPSFKSYLRRCRMTMFLDLARAELWRREVDLIHTLRKVHQAMRLPESEDLMVALTRWFYEPSKKLASLEEGIYGVLDEFVQRRHPLAIVSNTMVPAAVLDEHLSELGLLKYFPVRIYSCVLGVRKPHAQMFLAALRALNARPQDCVFVGDKPRLDIKGARRLGMITVLKAARASRGRCRPDYVLPKLKALPQLMQHNIGWEYWDSALTLSEEELSQQRGAQAIPDTRAQVAQTA